MLNPEQVRETVASGYDAVAEAYAQLEGEEEWPRMRWLADLLARLDAGSDVLDLGCGNGIPATQAIAQRHNAVGVDISARQIALARKNVPNADFMCGDAASLDFPENRFDAVVSFYMLGHIPRAEHARLLARIFGWLRPRGYFLVSVEEEEEPDTVADWLGTPMFFSSFDADTVLGMLREVGFDVVREEPEVQLEGGREVPFRWVLARKLA
ncbi:MAG TPA: methyltransferase domain-containing protein [Gaiellaceae bacterium]|nr:methyltransferase domain-containing protein [Gaiellaceae bacterium]